MADPDVELRREPGFTLLAQPAFLLSVISSFFVQNKGAGPPRPSPTVDHSANQIKAFAVVFKQNFIGFRWSFEQLVDLRSNN